MLECKASMKDAYYHWLKDHGAYDFVDYIIRKNEESGFRIGPERANFSIDKITSDNLRMVIDRLALFRRFWG